MIIAISGTPGVGKTAVSKILAKNLGYELISVNVLAKKRGFVIGHDEKTGALIVDEDKLSKTRLCGNFIVDGHLAHFIPSDMIIVLRTKPDELKRRLEKKGWSKEKINTNVEAEILGVIAWEARQKNKDVYEVDTSSKTLEQTAKEIEQIIKGRGKKCEIDWLEDYGDMLKP